MILRFKKGKGHKPSAFACIREDGSATYQSPLLLPVEHDLLHYAVETTMGWRRAFLGIVASGRDMDSFGTKNGVKDTYTDEETWAEMTVGMFQWLAMTGGPAQSDGELLETNAQYYAERDLVAPPLTQRHLEEIRACYAALRRQWDALPEGGTMELTF